MACFFELTDTANVPFLTQGMMCNISSLLFKFLQCFDTVGCMTGRASDL